MAQNVETETPDRDPSDEAHTPVGVGESDGLQRSLAPGEDVTAPSREPQDAPLDRGAPAVDMGTLDGSGGQGRPDPEWRADRLQQFIDSSALQPRLSGRGSGDAGPVDAQAITDPPPPPPILARPAARGFAAAVLVALAVAYVAGMRGSSSAPGGDEPLRNVEVHIAVEPGTARLQVDGKVVANPFSATLAAGGTHLIEASASGHRSWASWVAFEQDRRMSIQLVAGDQ